MFGDLDKFWSRYGDGVLEGVWTTLIISAFSILLGTIGGFIIGFCRNTHISRKDNIVIIIFKRGIKYIFDIYIALFRYTPFIAQAFFFYYVFFVSSNNPIFVGTIVLSLNVSAFMAIIMEGGIKSIDEGQYKAGRSLGMSHRITFTRIIFPQALKNMVPAMSNEFVNAIKATSVLSVIGVGELLFKVHLGASNGYDFAAAFTISIIIYFIICLVFISVLKLFSKWLARRW